MTAASRLDAWFQKAPFVAVAFSGGVDSALVAYWARQVLGKDRCAAWIGDSASLKRTDLDSARRFSASHDITLVEVNPQEIASPRYARNSPDRCFHCKTALYSSISRQLQKVDEEWWICSGANLDDMSDYRPGLIAADKYDVRHPLLECEIGKSVVRELARANGLSVWDKPASPCLSSRIPYGHPVNLKKLSQVEEAEGWLQERGFDVCRVRHYGGFARIEVPQGRISELDLLWEEVQEMISRLGIERVELDREGLVSGKLNRAIDKGIKLDHDS